MAPIDIVTGYRPGLIGQVVSLHAAYYSQAMGYGQPFESRVASGLAEFAGRLDQPCNRVWTVWHQGAVAGSVAIDGQDLGGHVAHLRWFIVGDGLRGTGLGRRLLAQAVQFCDDQGFDTTHLWTVRGLDAAVHLYRSVGFALAAEYDDQSWGLPVREMRLERPHPRRVPPAP
jgi:GNAT superfamily N-acetyltransferase